MNLHRVLSTSAVALGAVLLSLGLQALAYTAPGSTPPLGDASAPLNTSGTAQTKTGKLTLNGGPLVVGDATGYTFTSTIGVALVNKELRILDATPTDDNGKVLSSNGNGVGSWNSPTTGLGLQKAVSGSCTVGSSITAINATTGVVTCGQKMQAGVNTGQSTNHSVTFASAMPDTTYALTFGNGDSTSNTANCFQIEFIKSTTGFTFVTPDTCSVVPYNWIAIDY